ncbi:MAG: hypothetical protein ACTHOP_22170 [Mesorhizobium sp.]
MTHTPSIPANPEQGVSEAMPSRDQISKWCAEAQRKTVGVVEQTEYVVRAALTAAIGAGGQAVAEWQRHAPPFGWQRVPPEDIEHYRNKGAELRPLYTHPAPSGQVVAVKPLEWKFSQGIGRGSVDSWRAEHAFPNVDEYKIFCTPNGFEWHLAGVSPWETCESLEAAKAAAQADFERRILSALAHPVQPVWRDDHRFAVVSSDFSRPYLLGAYATIEAATKAQCGNPDQWPVYERIPAAPQPKGE